MKCRTVNCDEPARDADYCWRCWEEIAGEPCPAPLWQKAVTFLGLVAWWWVILEAF